jgi:hypothetical protein
MHKLQVFLASVVISSFLYVHDVHGAAALLKRAAAVRDTCVQTVLDWTCGPCCWTRVGRYPENEKIHFEDSAATKKLAQSKVLAHIRAYIDTTPVDERLIPLIIPGPFVNNGLYVSHSATLSYVPQDVFEKKNN